MTKHRHSYPPTPEYRRWKDMRGRCRNKNHKLYPYYGARGISVCKRWDDFQTYLDDIGERPSEAHSLDRIDNNGNYEPSNVRWATSKQQQNNTRQNVKVVHEGKVMNMKEFCEKTGHSYATAQSRRYRAKLAGKKVTKVYHV